MQHFHIQFIRPSGKGRSPMVSLQSTTDRGRARTSAMVAAVLQNLDILRQMPVWIPSHRLEASSSEASWSKAKWISRAVWIKAVHPRRVVSR